jgi:hypothetical protein
MLTIKDLPVVKEVELQEDNLLDEYLRIDILHYACPFYRNGGWVRIHPSIYIKPVGIDFKLPLIKAEGIPLAPFQHNYRSKSDRLFFSLYFPAISNMFSHIDIIEKEGGDSSYFNMYNVSLASVRRKPIIIKR